MALFLWRALHAARASATAVDRSVSSVWCEVLVAGAAAPDPATIQTVARDAEVFSGCFWALGRRLARLRVRPCNNPESCGTVWVRVEELFFCYDADAFVDHDSSQRAHHRVVRRNQVVCSAWFTMLCKQETPTALRLRCEQLLQLLTSRFPAGSTAHPLVEAQSIKFYSKPTV